MDAAEAPPVAEEARRASRQRPVGRDQWERAAVGATVRSFRRKAEAERAQFDPTSSGAGECLLSWLCQYD